MAIDCDVFSREKQILSEELLHTAPITLFQFLVKLLDLGPELAEVFCSILSANLIKFSSLQALKIVGQDIVK